MLSLTEVVEDRDEIYCKACDPESSSAAYSPPATAWRTPAARPTPVSTTPVSTTRDYVRGWESTCRRHALTARNIGFLIVFGVVVVLAKAVFRKVVRPFVYSLDDVNVWIFLALILVGAIWAYVDDWKERGRRR